MPQGDLFRASSMPDRDWWSALWPRPEETLRALGIEPDMTVLDLCCGDGYFTAPLAKIVGGKVCALDADCAMIEAAKAEVARQGASVRQWICADAMALTSHLAEPVDYVLMANTLHGVPDQAGLARAVRAVLRPYGVFAVVNWYPAEREDTPVLGRPRGPEAGMRMSPQAVAEVVEPAGFHLLRIVDLPPYHYGALFAALPMDRAGNGRVWLYGIADIPCAYAGPEAPEKVARRLFWGGRFNRVGIEQMGCLV